MRQQKFPGRHLPGNGTRVY